MRAQAIYRELAPELEDPQPAAPTSLDMGAKQLVAEAADTRTTAGGDAA